jgi:carboxypeptidase family protein
MSLLEGTRSKSAGNSLRKTARWVGGTLAVFMACFPLFSQTNQGGIQGGVFDQTGGAIVAAMVTITDISRGVTQALITDSAGQYVANNLTPGTYTVRGEAKGFRPIEHTGVLVEVGRNVRVDLCLEDLAN